MKPTREHTRRETTETEESPDESMGTREYRANISGDVTKGREANIRVGWFSTTRS